MAVRPKDDELVFYYSRERRLANADEAVRRLNERGPRKRPTLFQTLTATKAQAFLLLAIIMLSATVVVINFVIPSADEVEYKGNKLSISAFRYNDATYIALKKTTKGKNAYVGPIIIRVKFQGQKTFALSEELRFSDMRNEEFKYKVEATGERIEALVEIEGRYLLLKVKAQ